MTAAFQVVAIILCVFGVLEGLRSLDLLRDRDPDAATAGAAAALLLCLGLVFIVMARIDG